MSAAAGPGTVERGTFDWHLKNIFNMLSKIVVALVLCWGVESFPDGAPIDTCVRDRPNQPNHSQHRTQPLSTLPYRVLASGNSYAPNTPITGLWNSVKLLFGGNL